MADFNLFDDYHTTLDQTTLRQVIDFFQLHRPVLSIPYLEQSSISRIVPDELILLRPIVVDGKVQGLVAVYEMPFLKYTMTSTKLFGIYLDWLGRSIENIEKYTNVSEKSIVDDSFGVYKHSFFLDRIEEELEQSRQYMVPLSILQLHIANYEKIKDARRKVIKKGIIAATQTLIRKTDCLALDADDSKLNLLLPFADDRHVENLKSKILARLNRYELKINSENDATGTSSHRGVEQDTRTGTD